MKYSVERVKSFGKFIGPLRETIFLGDLEKVKEFIKNMKSNENIVEIKEYHLVYKHIENLPEADGIDGFINKPFYKEYKTVMKEDLISIKQKDYNENLRLEKEFQNFCITYKRLELHDLLDKYILSSCTYEDKNQNLNDMKKTLYEHSKYKNVYNIEFYQFRYLTETELKENNSIKE